MNSLLFYIIASGVSLGLFITAYQLLLKNNTRFNLCRFYLISAILFSFIIPFITIDIGISFVEKKEVIGYQSNVVPAQNFEVQELPAEPIQIEKNAWDIDYTRIASIVFLTISLLLFARFIFRFGSIILIQTSGNRYENEDGTNLIFTDKTDNAFSFLGSIFINPLKFTDEEKRLIIEHEREHIRHLHSIDLILIELLIVLQWFNPFAYIARRKLIEIHEFIADNGVIQKGADPYSYQNLLLSVVSSSCLPTVGNQLSALITKKRIAMIGKPLTQTGNWTRFLVLVPITLVLIIGISAFSPTKPKTENQDDIRTELFKKAENEGVNNAFQDIYFELNPNESKNLITTRLTKGNDYIFYFFTNCNEDKIRYIINGSHFPNEVSLYAKKLTYTANQSKELSITVTSEAKSKIDVLIRVCLKGKNKEFNNNLKNSLPLISEKEVDEIIPEKPRIESQQEITIEEENSQSSIKDTFLVVEQMPTFGNGNEDEFPKWVASNMQYPKEAIEKGIFGRVFIQFLISKDGSIKNPKVIKGVDPILDAEALRLINICPKWNPGKQRGIAVDVKMVQPITFSAIKIDKTELLQQTENQEIDQQTLKKLKEKADNEIRTTYLKDFSYSLKPSSVQKYNLVLKKEAKYEFNFFTNSKSDKVNFTLSQMNKGEEVGIMISGTYSDLSKVEFAPKETAVYHIKIENPGSSNTVGLVYLTLQEINEIETSAVKNESKVDEDEVFLVVEQMPVFTNGIKGEFNDWIKSNIQYPKEASEKGIQGRVFVQFVIEKDGSVTNAKVLRGVDPALDKEALRVVLSSPKWQPGMQREQKVRVLYTFPITFQF